MEYTEEYFVVQKLIADADKRLQNQNKFFNSNNITPEEKSDYRTYLMQEVDRASADIDEDCLRSLSSNIKDFYCADRFCSSFEGKEFLQKRIQEGNPINVSKFLNQKAKDITKITEYMSRFWKDRDAMEIVTKEILEEFQGSFEERFLEDAPEVYFLGIYTAWKNSSLDRGGK